MEEKWEMEDKDRCQRMAWPLYLSTRSGGLLDPDWQHQHEICGVAGMRWTCRHPQAGGA